MWRFAQEAASHANMEGRAWQAEGMQGQSQGLDDA